MSKKQTLSIDDNYELLANLQVCGDDKVQLFVNKYTKSLILSANAKSGIDGLMCHRSTSPEDVTNYMDGLITIEEAMRVEAKDLKTPGYFIEEVCYCDTVKVYIMIKQLCCYVNQYYLDVPDADKIISTIKRFGMNKCIINDENIDMDCYIALYEKTYGYIVTPHKKFTDDGKRIYYTEITDKDNDTIYKTKDYDNIPDTLWDFLYYSINRLSELHSYNTSFSPPIDTSNMVREKRVDHITTNIPIMILRPASLTQQTIDILTQNGYGDAITDDCIYLDRIVYMMQCDGKLEPNINQAETTIYARKPIIPD